MQTSDSSPEVNCGTCGGPLVESRWGPRCTACVLAMVEEPENEEEGYMQELFPELRLEEKVARGGFGVVYRAEHRRMKRPVALKFLDSPLTRKREAVELFQQEMIAVGGLDHPGIVRAHDAGERDGHWYLIMEFVEGMDCAALVKKHGALPVAESCEIIRRVALALHHAHGRGLVHRDVKPGNVMVSRVREGEDDAAVGLSSVKILDFGLAGLAVAPVFSQALDPGGSSLFMGTMQYVSPEQIESPARVDARADIYSLGATLWRLLSGQALRGETSPEMSLFVAMKSVASEPVRSLATVRPDLPKPLVQLCDAMLALDREKRPASAAEVARLLEPWSAGAELPRLFEDGPLEEKSIIFPRKNWRPWWTAAALVAFGALMTGLLLKERRREGAAPEPLVPPGWRPLFSKAQTAGSEVEAAFLPQLLSTDWEVEREVIDNGDKECARLTPEGDIININNKLPDKPKMQNQPLRRIRGTSYSPAVKDFINHEIRCVGVGPAGHLVWGMPEEPSGHQIGRALPDGTLLPALRYDFAAEFPPGAYEIGRQFQINQGRSVADAEPWDFAFATAQNLPPDTGLTEGDVLVADHGQRKFLPGVLSVPGLWCFRLDSNAPARRFAVGREGNWFCDVEITRQGVFVLHAIDYHNQFRLPLNDPSRLSSHFLMRWDLNGWHPCTTDQIPEDPSGLAADPLSTDLYLISGGRSRSVGSPGQAISRLRRTGPDRYTVEPFVTRLGKPAKNGIGFSHDGQRMIITDNGNHAIVVLKRKQAVGSR
jgi:serine/threonine protein kinase